MQYRTTLLAATLISCLAGLSAFRDARGAERLLEHYVVRQWTQDEGLPSDQIEDFEAGPDGFFWLASGRALYRFDGATSELLMQATEAGPPISAFIPLTEGSALVSLLTSVRQYQAGGAPADRRRLDSPLGANIDFVRAPNGVVWGVAQSGVIRYDDGPPRSFAAPEIQPHAPDSRFHGGCIDTVGRIWLVTQSRLLRFDPDAAVFEAVEAPDNPDLAIGGYERIFAGRDGRVWLYLHPCHLFVHEDASGWRRIETGYTAEQRLGIRTLLETGPDEVWFGTENALHRICKGVRAELTAADLGAPLYPSALVPSENGGLWVALRGAGLLHLRPRAVRMLRSPALSGRQPFYALSPLKNGAVRASVAGQGLFCGPVEQLAREEQTPLLQQTSVATILNEPDGVTWYATLGNYLIRQQGAFEEVVAIERAAPLPTWNVTALVRTRDGVLWAASPNGLFYVEDCKPPLLRVVTKERTDTLILDRSGTLYAACVNGLFRIAPGSQDVVRVAAPPRAHAIRVLAEDQDGSLWAGTTGGLFLCDRKGGRLTPAPGEWYQPERCIQQILFDHEGRLWLGTRTGILRLGATPNEGARLFDQTDGMETVECSGGFTPAGLACEDGRLLFPTLNGLACVDPQRLAHTAAPTVRPLLIDSPSVLPAGTRSVTFRFSALPVSEGLRARFSWQLDDEPWSAPSAARSAAFGRLTPGQHRLRVRALDREGGGAAPLVHLFLVRPLFWQSPLFRVTVLLLALGVSGALAAALTRRRAQLKLRRLARERALDLERARIARDLHDDIGAGLTRMAMLSAQGCYIPDMPQAANDLNARIFSAARETSRALNEIVWAANPDKDDTEQVAAYLVLYAENFLRDAGLRAKVLLAPDLPSIRLPPSIRHPLFRAVKEALANTAKHARATTVTLAIRCHENALIVEVADDGCGFSPETVHAGNGLAFMRKRLSEIGGACDLDTAPGRGTRLTFTLHLTRQAEPPLYA